MTVRSGGLSVGIADGDTDGAEEGWPDGALLGPADGC